MAEVTIHPPSENDISRADATFQAVVEGVHQPTKSTSLQRAKRWAVPYLMTAGIALLAAACGSGAKAVETNPNATVTSTATPTEIPPTATASPSPEPPKSTPPPEPTKAPPTPTVIPATPTKEATPTPKLEKSPLPTYGVFMGSFLNGEGMIVVASIPETSTEDSVLVYYSQQIAGGGESFVFKAKIESIQGGTIQAIKPPGGIWRIQATLDNTGKTLTGKIENGRPGAKPTWEEDFQANFTGTGKANVINGIKRAKVIGSKLGYVPDLSKVRLDELKSYIDLDNLPQ